MSIPTPSPEDAAAADSNMVPMERRSLSDVEIAQYIAAYWHIHSYLRSKGHFDRAAWLLSSAFDYANSWLYVSRNSASWFSTCSPALTDTEYSLGVRNLLLASPFGSGPEEVVCACSRRLGNRDILHDLHKEPYHQMDCPAASCFRMYRHQEVSNVVQQYVQKRIPDIAITTTPSLNSTVPGVRHIIPDLLITPTGRSGKYIDFTISNPAAPSNCGPSAPIQAALVPNITNMGYGLCENIQILRNMYRIAPLWVVMWVTS